MQIRRPRLVALIAAAVVAVPGACTDSTAPNLGAAPPLLQYGSLAQSDINTGYKSLMALLTGLDPTVESDIANSIWYRRTLPIDPAFVAAAHGYFDAQVSPLDFDDEPTSVETVNAWVRDKTSGRISSILDQVDPQDQMYLVNAIYFKASWRTAFDRNDTKDETFTRGDGAAEIVPMMHLDHEGVGTRAWADGTLMAELPYGNTAFNMDVYLPPDTSTVEHLIERMKLDDLAGATSTAQVQLWMPRVKLEYERHLAADLAGLGMGEAFSGAADFSGVTTSHAALMITDVLQKTFLAIDEEGTEAAAVTKVTMGDSAPVISVIRCDRPYLIVIRERLSGAILFIGKINTI